MTLSPAFLDELRARTHLSALIGKTTKLTKAGREMRGCCPFHNEKTPSFYVNDDKGFYHCFGCSVHGDAIRWMTDQRGLPFIDAVKELAQAAGLDMPAPDPRSAERQERAKGLHEAMQAAADWFEAQLGGLDGAEARGVLARRGIDDATRRAFGFGYAPDSRGKLKTALREFGDAMLVEAGLLIEVEGKEPYDRFRGRLMIPIRDPRGRVIAFGGRVIGEGEPKYLNSPDTPLFDKGRTLYNLDRAAPAARKAGRVLVVEGYMDVVALARAGIDEVVAPLGTAVTEAQLERLWRLADVPILCLDGDAAGQKAALRAGERALPMLQPDQSLKFAPLPQGQDPDDVIKVGGAPAFEIAISSSAPLLQVIYVSERSKSAIDSPEGRAGLQVRLGQKTDLIIHPIVKKQYKHAFNDLFYEDFGWKKEERNVIGRSIIKTGPHGKREIFRLFVRSALYGLSRFPAVIGYAMEPIQALRLVDDDLERWRESVLDAGLRIPHLDKDAVVSIFETRQLTLATARVLQTDLRFQWDLEEQRAMRRLRGLIDMLQMEQDIDERMGELNARLIADLSLDSYDEIEAERRLLRAQKLAIYDMGYELGSDEPQQDAA